MANNRNTGTHFHTLDRNKTKGVHILLYHYNTKGIPIFLRTIFNHNTFTNEKDIKYYLSVGQRVPFTN